MMFSCDALMMKLMSALLLLVRNDVEVTSRRKNCTSIFESATEPGGQKHMNVEKGGLEYIPDDQRIVDFHNRSSIEIWNSPDNPTDDAIKHEVELVADYLSTKNTVPNTFDHKKR
jgi:hypothetical protein